MKNIILHISFIFVFFDIKASNVLDTNQINFYFHQADSLYNIDLKKSTYWFSKADSYAIENHNKLYEGIAKRELAKNYLTQGKVEISDEYVNQAIKIFIELNENERLAGAYSLKSILKGRLLEYEEAIQLNLKAIEIYKKKNNEQGLSSIYSNISISYIRIKDFDKAEEYLILSEKLNKKLGKESSLFYTYLNFGTVYREKFQYQKSEKVLLRALQIAKKFNNVDGEVTCLNIMGLLFERKNEKELAVKYYIQALTKAREAQLPMEESEVLEDLHNFFIKSGDFEQGYEYYKQYITLKDSMYNIDKINKISELEKQLELHEKENTILEKNAQISQANLEVEHQKNIKYIILFAVFILVISILFVIKSLIEKNRSNRMLKQRQIIINEKNEELNQQNEEILAQRDQIEMQRNILETKNYLVTESINTARRIQTAFFQSEEKEKDLLPENFAFFKPKDIVSGDFYWSNINEKNPNIVYISVVDCTGHGVPGALMSMLGLSFINEIFNENPLIMPAELLERLKIKVIKELNQTNSKNTKEGMDMSVVRIDTDTNEVIFAGANNPFYYITKNKIHIVKGTKQPIGISEISREFKEHTIQFEKGDLLYLFSDGFADQFGGPKGKKMGYKTFREKLLEVAHMPMQKQKEELENYFNLWKMNEEQVDDVCILGVRI